jgi:pterin-4a-carbinolamine dehydratase
MTTHDDLALEWADIDGEGLVRVFPTANFKVGFVLTAHIGKAAEDTGFYPEVLLTSTKLTVTVPDDTDGRDHQLARAIDDILSDAASF